MSPTSQLYSQTTTTPAVKKVQSWNGLTQDGLLGPATKDITYWPTTTSRYSAVHVIYGPLSILGVQW
ncbi:MAG: peptidoglycan-binding protein [Bifidobacteriaceae bacterium]|nr:peptidoglycan-binding protein [Bifidobacteriaceae bacterium]